MHGLAIADDPLGPFKKHPLNPVVNSGHETTLFPFKGGVAALVIRDGNEHDTIQYAEDWVNFEIESIVELMPNCRWPVHSGRLHQHEGWPRHHLGHFPFHERDRNWKQNHAILARFDCDLSQDVHDPRMKGHHVYHSPEFHYQHGLSGKQRERMQRKRLR